MTRVFVLECVALFLMLMLIATLYFVGELDERIRALENGVQTQFIMKRKSWSDGGGHLVFPKEEVERIKKELEK